MEVPRFTQVRVLDMPAPTRVPIILTLGQRLTLVNHVIGKESEADVDARMRTRRIVKCCGLKRVTEGQQWCLEPSDPGEMKKLKFETIRQNGIIRGCTHDREKDRPVRVKFLETDFKWLQDRIGEYKMPTQDATWDDILSEFGLMNDDLLDGLDGPEAIEEEETPAEGETDAPAETETKAEAPAPAGTEA